MTMCNIRHTEAFAGRTKLSAGRIRPACQCLDHAGIDDHGRRKDFFQWRVLGFFSCIFPGGAKSGEILFFSLETKKTTCFCWKFQNPGGQGPPSDDDVDDAQSSLGYVCRPNCSFAFDFLQYHVHIRHRSDTGNPRVRVRRECISEAEPSPESFQ